MGVKDSLLVAGATLGLGLVVGLLVFIAYIAVDLRRVAKNARVTR